MAGSLAVGELSTADGAAVAGPDDDAELRALLRRSVIPGSVRVAFTREPDFFAADGLAGAEDITLVSRRRGRVVAMGRCSVLPLMRNGVPRRIGYLGALRITTGVRESARLLREGYELLSQLTGPLVEGYFTSIASDNARARAVLERGGRLGLPAYRPLCDLVTLVAPVTRAPSPESAALPDEELREFLRQEAPLAQLALAWDDATWRGLARHNLSARDFSVVRRGDAVVAAAAVWDQRAFRQTVVDGYEGLLGTFRPVLNPLFAVARRPRLPPPGTVLAQGSILGASVRDPRDWPALWNQLQQQAAARALSWLSISRDVRDPQLGVLRRLLRAREYRTTLYEVTWRDGPRWPDPWDARSCRPEVALL